jgi:hypothetical protein
MKQVPILTILIAVLILITASTAGAVSNAAVLYLRVAAGARPAGMGEAFVSMADDATATYWNPAGLGNAPIAGRLETENLPHSFDEITNVVTMKNYKQNTETWVIAGEELIMYDGKTWNSGRQYVTSSDQDIHDFLRTILNVQDEEKLGRMAEKIVSANSNTSPEDVDLFIETVRANVPEDYKEMDDLEQGLDTLKTGYEMCLLNTDRFRSLQGKLRDGMKDSLLTSEELDKITFSLHEAVLRFLPSRLIVPHAAAIGGNMYCLGSTGSYLWVGTDDGLYRRSMMTWARYTVDHNLPSDTILSLDDEEEHLLIGTSAGVAEYYHGSFKDFSDLPKSPATAISFGSLALGYAVVGDALYRYDGKKWHDNFSYTVRLDDSIDKIVERIAIYHTAGEYEYLTRRIKELNSSNVPTLPEEIAVPAEASTESEIADTVSTPAESPAVAPDSTESSEDVEVLEESETPEAAPSEPWLVEGNVIKLPISPHFRYDVTALFVDDVTLLAFNGKMWDRYGYYRYVVPGPDSTEEIVSMTSEDIARKQYPFADSARIIILAENIDEYNEMNGQPATSGQAVYVYNHNIGATIHSIGKVFGDIYFGTEYSLEKWTNSGWKAADFSRFEPQPSAWGRSYENWAYAGWEAQKIGRLERQRFVGVYDFDGQAYYIAARGMGIETKGRREFTMMFVKWLPTLDLDMYYGFVSYVHNVRGLGTFGVSGVYLTYGSIQFTDPEGQSIGEENPFEFALALSYGTSLTSRLNLGGTVKAIHSRLATIGAGQEQGSGIAWAFAVDAGILYRITDRMQFGSAFTNLGPDISYIDADQKDPLPLNMAFGLSYRVWDTPYNRLVVQGELNKMLTNLTKGIKQEMEFAIRHIGAEYWYANFIAVRAGYKYDKEGQVKHLTFGAGLQYGAARFDMAYVPSSVESPLANTLRISFSLMF